MSGAINQSQYAKQRRYRRYALRYPVHLEFSGNGESVSGIEAVSRNVSIGGMLLESSASLPEDCTVTLTMKIEGRPVVRPIQLAARGKVIRVMPKEAGFAIAIECIRPMSQLESFFAGG
jgi:hypothetical protein